MPSSQIKQAPDDFFQLRRFKDLRHRPGRNILPNMDDIHPVSSFREDSNIQSNLTSSKRKGPGFFIQTTGCTEQKV